MNKHVTDALELELRNSVNKDLVGYCDRLGSGRLIDIAEQYGSSADVVEMADLLLSKGIIVIFSPRLRTALDKEQNFSNSDERTSWLDEIESRLTMPDPKSSVQQQIFRPKVQSVIDDRIRLNEELKRKAKADRIFIEDDD